MVTRPVGGVPTPAPRNLAAGRVAQTVPNIITSSGHTPEPPPIQLGSVSVLIVGNAWGSMSAAERSCLWG